MQAYITGIGLISPLGLTWDAFKHNLFGGAAAPNELTLFEAPEGAPETAFELQEFELRDYVPSVQTFIDRTSAFGLAAAKCALDDAKLAANEEQRKRCGLFYATTFGCLTALELFYDKVLNSNPKFAPPLLFIHSYANTPCSLIAIEFGIEGISATFSSGAFAALDALNFALVSLDLGRAETVLVVASESLSRSLYTYYHEAGFLASDGRIEPLSVQGTGTILGEGAAALVLETAESAARRGAKKYARLVSAAPASGRDRKGALANSLAKLGGKEKPDALFASANGVKALDEAEAEAFRECCPDTPVRTLKKLTGECFSASNLFAVAAAAAALEEKTLPDIPSAEPLLENVKLRCGAPGTIAVTALDEGNAAASALLARA